MSEKLEVIITAVDQATGVLKGIAGVAQGILTVGLAVAGAAAGALAAGLGLSIKEAMEAQEVQAQLASVLKSTGGAAGVSAEMANALAEQLSGVTRYSDEAILSAENLLLTFTNIGKDVFPDVTEIALDMSTAMGQDLKTSAIQLGKALNNPLEGLTALTRVGVTFTDEQKKMIESMVAAGDVAGAQAVIMAELEKEFGGSAEAAGQTFAGQLDILKNSLLNVAEGVGMQLMPILTELVTNNILPFVQTYGPQLAAWFGEFLPQAIAVLSGFWKNTLQPAIEAVWTWLSTVLIPFLANEVYPWLATNIPIAVQFLSDVWTNVLQPAIAAVWGWLSTVLIPFLVNEVYPWLQTNIPKALKFLSDVWTNVLKPAIDAVWSWMSTVLIPFLAETVYPWLQENIPAAIQTLSDFWTNTLKPAIDAVYTFIVTYVVPIFDALWELFNVAGALAVAGMATLWDTKLKPALDAVWKFVKENVIPILEDLWEWFNDKIIPIVATLVDGALANLKQGFKDVRDAIQWVIDKIVALINKLQSVTLPDWIERHSPSPFEMTFIGAKDAINELVRVSLPSLQHGLVGLSPAMVGVGAGGGGGGGNQYWSLTINEAGRSVDPVGAFELMRALAG